MHLLELFPGPLFLSPLHLIQADEPSISESEGTLPPQSMLTVSRSIMGPSLQMTWPEKFETKATQVQQLSNVQTRTSAVVRAQCHLDRHAGNAYRGCIPELAQGNQRPYWRILGWQRSQAQQSNRSSWAESRMERGGPLARDAQVFCRAVVQGNVEAGSSAHPSCYPNGAWFSKETKG